MTNMNFNSDWQCYQQTVDRIDDIAISPLTIMPDDHEWLSIELPHIVDIDKQNSDSCIKIHNWWYRKNFNGILSEQSSDAKIYLNFDLSTNDNSYSILNAIATIWLNKIQIFLGSIIDLQKPIELTQNLVRDDELQNNTLVISCTNMSLCLHSRLSVHDNVISTTEEILCDDQTKHDNIQQLVNSDDNNQNINVELNHNVQLNTAQTTSSSSIEPSESITDETQTDEGDKHFDNTSVPRLAIVILIVGTRGDVQPFIALGQALKAVGHRVRLATHETFRSFVRKNDLEFYPLAGDPDELMSFMVKNAGLIPSMSSVVSGDIGKKRHSLEDILISTWDACTADDDETFHPFTAEAIIANPPSFGHIHCAEKLKIPLHIMFTMPWSPTSAFPHPMCNIDISAGSPEKLNLYSYFLVEMLTWSGMSDITNKFRKQLLHLTPLNSSQAVRAMVYEQIPHTYCWSPSLVPKPQDWGPHINISGFLFLNLTSSYTDPPEDLRNFLGLNTHDDDKPKLPPPIYIGFGSITGHDANHLLNVIIKAIDKTGYRALLSGFAKNNDTLPDNILKIGNVPHDWLFQYVSAVCHHGGAGTTAAGLRAGKPTIIVPFFGDQFFWGEAIEKIGAGPTALPGKNITVDQLAEAFEFVHKPAAQEAAQRLSEAFSKEDGCAAAVQAFHANLPLSRMRSDLESTFVACYYLDKYGIQISRPVARVLVSAGMINESELRIHPTKEWTFMYNNYTRIPTDDIFHYTPKAVSNLIIDLSVGIRQATSNSDMAAGTIDVIAKVAKALGLGVGHISNGCLSLYGDITDFLDKAPSFYDPYSEPNAHPRRHVEDFKSGAEAAKKSLWFGLKDGITGLIKEPSVGYQRHGILGGVGGVVLATVNVFVKPIAGTLSSITWLGRGTYASVKNAMTTGSADRVSTAIKTLGFEPITPVADKEEEQENNNNIINDNVDDEDNEGSHIAKVSSALSGLKPKVCQQILNDFEQVKKNRKRISAGLLSLP
ncbi:unnamed protein product [Adineta steineri]|uniref:Uncharacterized protein n=1 Tax=Adineta steineri TaxID=433720 RepID=A0A818ZPL6_9BILA|nr:unnamed protein product [Adineta steineri]